MQAPSGGIFRPGQAVVAVIVANISARCAEDGHTRERRMKVMHVNGLAIIDVC